MLNERKATISEVISEGILRYPAHTEYLVQYSDNTHCKEDEWHSLIEIHPESTKVQLVGSEDAQWFYNIKILPQISAVDESDEQQEPRKKKEAASAQARAHVVADALTQALVRSNILRPDMTPDVLLDVFRLSKSKAVVLVPDTNALSTGTLHWLLHALNQTQVWLLPVVISLVQVQLRDAQLKASVKKRELSRLPSALRSRQLINASLSLLERYRERYQVLEVDPQLLRYVRPSGAGSADPDEGDVLEDRLLMEAIHGALRATRSRAEKRVVTSDILLARMLRAEGLPNLFLQRPSLPTGAISCLRYEPLAKAFVGSSLLHLLWELAHTFSSIRLLAGGKPIVALDAYWASKSVVDWAHERMLIAWEEDAKAVPAEVTPDSPDDVEVELDESATVAPDTTSGAGDAASALVAPDDDFTDLTRAAYSRASLPEASFPQIVRIAVSASRRGSTIGELLDGISREVRPSEDIARAAVEVLLRSSLLTGDGSRLIATETLRDFLQAIAALKLDLASQILCAYQPYRWVMEILREREVVDKGFAYDSLAARLDLRPSREGCERLWRVPVYLGQAWSDDSGIRDGSQRPDQLQIRDVFLNAFNALSQDGLCPLRELIPFVCGKLRVSPWYLQSSIQALVSEDRLAEVSFQPSAGKRLMARDQVINIHSGDVRVISLPLDRMDIAGKPVFTVVRGVTL